MWRRHLSLSKPSGKIDNSNIFSWAQVQKISAITYQVFQMHMFKENMNYAKDQFVSCLSSLS